MPSLSMRLPNIGIDILCGSAQNFDPTVGTCPCTENPVTKNKALHYTVYSERNARHYDLKGRLK
jgi:hypothetical protein